MLESGEPHCVSHVDCRQGEYCSLHTGEVTGRCTDCQTVHSKFTDVFASLSPPPPPDPPKEAEGDAEGDASLARALSENNMAAGVSDEMYVQYEAICAPTFSGMNAWDPVDLTKVCQVARSSTKKLNDLDLVCYSEKHCNATDVFPTGCDHIELNLETLKSLRMPAGPQTLVSPAGPAATAATHAPQLPPTSGRPHA